MKGRKGKREKDEKRKQEKTEKELFAVLFSFFAFVVSSVSLTMAPPSQKLLTIAAIIVGSAAALYVANKLFSKKAATKSCCGCGEAKKVRAVD